MHAPGLPKLYRGELGDLIKKAQHRSVGQIFHPNKKGVYFRLLRAAGVPTPITDNEWRGMKKEEKKSRSIMMRPLPILPPPSIDFLSRK